MSKNDRTTYTLGGARRAVDLPPENEWVVPPVCVPTQEPAGWSDHCIGLIDVTEPPSGLNIRVAHGFSEMESETRQVRIEVFVNGTQVDTEPSFQQGPWSWESFTLDIGPTDRVKVTAEPIDFTASTPSYSWVVPGETPFDPSLAQIDECIDIADRDLVFGDSTTVTFRASNDNDRPALFRVAPFDPAHDFRPLDMEETYTLPANSTDTFTYPYDTDATFKDYALEATAMELRYSVEEA